ncbi:MAG: permease [Candidatus Dadabacteria bacterium]|nr:permease [Candidatus Dadabacteria bacterium]
MGEESIAVAVWGYLSGTFLVLAPVFLFGLFLSGLMRVLISREQVLGVMGGNDLRSSVAAALAGVPVPLCSCSVLPVVSELRSKGASKPACASFLITAPETGVDSIPVTYALLGPFMAVFRPLASFISAIVTSIMVMTFDRGEAASAAPAEEGGGHCCGAGGEEDDYVGFSELARSARFSLSRLLGRRNVSDPFGQKTARLRTILANASRRAFVEQMDMILYPLLIGVVAGAAIVALFPADLSAYGVTGYVQYLVLLAAGVPVYICATATTPIAAALVLKGVSPGAALVFLLSGPATNTATIAVLGRQFGWRFTGVYVSSICVTAVVTGALLDLALIATGFSVVASEGGLMGGMVGAVQVAGLIAFAAIAAWRIASGRKARAA